MGDVVKLKEYRERKAREEANKPKEKDFDQTHISILYVPIEPKAGVFDHKDIKSLLDKLGLQIDDQETDET